MDKLKVALVGVGGISSAHIPSWESMDDVELVALCDIRPERMEKYENVRKYTDLDEMLANETLDILDICTPTYMHADMAVKAMDMGINVISEKPVSLKKEDVKRVYDCAKKNNVKFFVAQVLRFMTDYSFIKEIYENKKYGKLLCGTMSRLEAYPAWTWDNWMKDEKRSGLVPFDLHIHDLDWLVYSFGKPVNYFTRRAKTPDCDYINISYDFDGFFIDTEASWFSGDKYPFNAGFKFQFEKAIITSIGGKITVYEKDGEAIDMTPGAVSCDGNEIGLPKSDAYADEIRYFTDCVKSDVFPEKIHPQELETVIDILNDILKQK